MKKRNIIIICIVLLSISLIVVGIILPPKNGEKKKNNKNETLHDVALKLYENKSYLKLPQNDKGNYYMTVSEYIKQGYNKKLIANNCQDDDRIIYFEEQKENSQGEYPFYIVESCREIVDELDPMTSLNGVAKEMYLENKYLELPKNDEGLYYMTLEEYKKRGYNTELIDNTCPNNYEIIYFDIENKDKYELYPYYLTTDCKETKDDKKDINTSLEAVAEDMYLNNKYLELPKNNNGIYYMTFEEYKNRGYNLKLIDNTCPNNYEIIYFDIENKDKYELYPYYFTTDCKEKEDDKTDINTSLEAVAKDMYTSNKYLELPKSKEGIYYMTLEEYKKRGYNLNLIDNTCPNSFEIIHFDIKNKDKYELYPYYIIQSCY